ncbi:MAG: (Fe-S)-binding protein [Myxococcales bacterium]|nr:(Fe-S)-binding protein [Myxococcales bacterium]
MSPIFTSLLLAAGLLFFAVTIFWRVRVLFALKPEPGNRLDRAAERAEALLVFGLGQRRLLDREERGPGLMHAAIFAAFMVLAARTLMLFVMGFSEGAHAVLSLPTHWYWSAHPNLAAVYHGYLLVKDVVALLAVWGASYFWFLRWRVKPDRMTPSWEAFLILGFIIGLMVTEFLFGASHLVAQGRPFDSAEPVTSTVAYLLSGLSPGAVAFLGNLGFWLHLCIILAFLNFLPYGKHFHVITALPNVYLRRLSPSGKLSTPNLEKEEFGAKTFKDLSWKQALDLYSCTECGRCQTHCPTYVTGKPLTHKGVNQDLKHWLWANQTLLATGNDEQGAAAELPPLVGGVLKPETVWACTSCSWCETACPVLIENVPRLIDMRRYKVQVEADFPPEIQRVFEGMERQGNPWGLSQEARTEWEGEPRLHRFGDGGQYEYLFFVGCAGAYDERQKKVTRALVRVMQEAGVSFATLGNEEVCTGDSARRLGNEYLFQTMAKANVEKWNGLEVKAVITQCPHCFNTIRNEYPEFGGNYRVVSHTELLAELVREGRVRLSRVMAERLAFHDPCYLGRHNGVFDAPREALAALPGAKLLELPRSRRESFCCGAGGGRMWLEEKIGQRINQNRLNEVALAFAHAAEPGVEVPSATDKRKPGKVGEYQGPGKGVLAVACPFCMTMLRDAVNETGREEAIQVKDVAELVAEAMEVKSAAATPEKPGA